MNGGMYGHEYMGVPMVQPLQYCGDTGGNNQPVKRVDKSKEQKGRKHDIQLKEVSSLDYSKEPGNIDELRQIIETQRAEIKLLGERNNSVEKRVFPIRKPGNLEYSDEPDAFDELLQIIEKERAKIKILEERNKSVEKREETTKDQKERKHGIPHKESGNPKHPKEPDAFDELLQIIEKERAKVKTLEERNKLVEKRSSEITKGMAKVLETKGNFENVNDKLANTNVTERFKNLYDYDWVKLSKWLIQTFPAIGEIEMIQSLTTLMKSGYIECLRLADEQIRTFLMLDKSQDIPANENHEELYAVRKQYAQTDTARNNVKLMVLDKILHAEENIFFNEEEKHEKTRQKLQDFFMKYLDCCWLMVVSNPPMALHFDVIGKPYCKEHFTKYAPKRPLDTTKCKEDTVSAVVWPCVCLQDRSAFYKKGDAIVVYAEKSSAENLGENSCCCFSKEHGEPNSRAIEENGGQYSTSARNNENFPGADQYKRKSDIW